MTGSSRKLAIASDLARERQSAIEQRCEATTSSRACGDETARLAAVAKAEYAARRRRDRLFNAHIFAEPAWDMLLDLFIQRHQDRPVTVHNLCIAAAVPQTTALRWIGKLAIRGFIERSPCPHDNRVIHVSLSAEGLLLMESYLRGQLGEMEALPDPPISFS